MTLTQRQHKHQQLQILPVVQQGQQISIQQQQSFFLSHIPFKSSLFVLLGQLYWPFFMVSGGASLAGNHKKGSGMVESAA